MTRHPPKPWRCLLPGGYVAEVEPTDLGSWLALPGE